MNVLLITLLFINFVIIYVLFKRNIEGFEVSKIDRPFVNVYDNNGNIINVALLSRPFFSKEHYDNYELLKKDFFILGISSYQEFPNTPKNPKDHYNVQSNPYNYIQWVNMCDGWLHCFRNRDNYLPKHMKAILLSESDFTDYKVVKPNKSVEKKYDFIYICHRDDLNDCSKDEWVAYNKNLDLAEKCFKIMCEKYNYKGLLVGRQGCKLSNKCNGKLETTPKLEYHDMQKKYDECKFIFLPNINDASPRVLTEALCHNIPCLVNKNIVGGWKYVNDKTGVFFNGIEDFEKQLNYIMSNLDTFEPRKYYKEHYGVVKSGKVLKEFVYEIFGSNINIPKEDVKYLTPEFPKKNYI